MCIRDRAINRETGISRGFIRKVFNGYKPSNTHHLEKCANEIKKIIHIKSLDYNNYFFDLETETNTLHAGIGCGLVHNSERRGEEFVTRKITKWLGQFVAWKAAVELDNPENKISYDFDITGGMISSVRDSGYIFANKYPKLRLGNLDVSRDWGHAKDYVKAMTLIMEATHADDWVVSTGDTHTITEFLKLAFELAGLGCWRQYVVIDEGLKRPAEVPFLKGDSSKIRETLGWKPEISFNQLVKGMVEHDINKYRGSEN
jgi:GDPmannose 4,6-dehydratase